MASLMHSYRRFRFLVRSVRWVELAVSALIVIGAIVGAGVTIALLRSRFPEIDQLLGIS